MKCSKCGNNLISGAAFCGHCGAPRLNTSTEQINNVPPNIPQPASYRPQFQSILPPNKGGGLKIFLVVCAIVVFAVIFFVVTILIFVGLSGSMLFISSVLNPLVCNAEQELLRNL